MLEPWQVVASTTSYEDQWLKVQSDRCLTSTGKFIEPYHVLHYPTWVNVVALTADAEIILVTQYRHGIKSILTELPCGSLERNDSNPEAAIRRELQEETGFARGHWFHTGSTYANPANHNNSVECFLAINVEQTQAVNPDESEHLEVLQKDFLEFLQQIWQGTIQLQGLHIAAIHFAVHFILVSQQPSLSILRKLLKKNIYES
jgi:8-oxo-dGTP pyrophosphatase MutT (NUDIX family)